jgi:PAS domain S-box-containing protein
LGRPKKEIIGKTVFDTYPQEQAEKYYQMDRELFNDPGTQVYEYPMKRSDGAIRNFIFSKATFSDFSGKIAGLIGVMTDITERKLAEEALRRSEQRKTILNRIANVFLTVPDNEIYAEVLGVFLQVMKSKFGVFGFIGANGDLVIPSMTRDVWSECQVPNKSIVFPPATWGHSLWGKAIREKKSFFAEGPFHTPEGHISIDNFLAVPIVFGNETIGLVSVANSEQSYTEEDRDLLESIANQIAPILNARLQRDWQEQERKQAEKELIRAKEDWELTFNSIPHLIAILDTQHRIVRVNKVMAAKLNIAPEEAVGRKCYEMVHKTGVPPQFCPHTKLLTDGMEHTVEIFDENLGGYFRINASPLRDSRGNLLGCVHLAQDITERKRAEAAMAHLSRQMELILNSAGEGIFGTDTAGKVTFVNPAMAQMLGWETAALLGQPIHDLCHHTRPDGQPLPSSECPIHLAFKDGRTHQADDEFFWRQDGTSFPVEYISNPIREGDQVVGTVVVIKDITERRQAEEAKLKLEAQLRQAQKMEAIGTLAGGIAHDFNNILGAIIGYGEMIQMFHTAVDPKVRKDVDEILRAAFRAKDLVQQILMFSRRIDQDRKPIQLQMIIKESLKFLRASLPSTIEIRRSLDPEVGPVLADPTQMQQVVMNLCTNAAHAMRKKGGVLEVGLTEVVAGDETGEETVKLAPGPHARLTVKDNGHGIPPEILDRIFDPYFSTKAMEEGTGLGLAVVEGIVQSHGGAITVESVPDVGTAFHVFIPILKRRDTSLPSETPTPIPKGQGRILFVDDEPVLVAIGQDILQNLGYEVVALTSSAAALEKFFQNPRQYDLAILDLTMPQMTGMELARKLLQIRPDLPIILSSGFADKIRPKEVMEMGVREVITKPWSIRSLAETIKKALG